MHQAGRSPQLASGQLRSSLCHRATTRTNASAQVLQHLATQSANSSSRDVIARDQSPADSASHPRVQGARSRRDRRPSRDAEHATRRRRHEYALGQWPMQVGDIHVQHVDRGPRALTRLRGRPLTAPPRRRGPRSRSQGEQSPCRTLHSLNWQTPSATRNTLWTRNQ